jgi:hypothetical protein
MQDTHYYNREVKRHRSGSSQVTQIPLLSKAIAILASMLLLVMLAACGAAIKTTGPAGTSTAQANTTSTVQAGATGTTSTQGTVQVTVTVPAGTINCGAIYYNKLIMTQPNDNLVAQALSCFWQAYQQGKPAALTYTQVSVDSGIIHNFLLQRVNNTLVLTDTVQHYVLPHTKTTLGTYTCNALAKLDTGLQAQACGKEGDVVIQGTTSGAQP